MLGSGTTKTRIVFLDALKIVSIFAMMVLHMASANWASVSVYSDSWTAFHFYDSLVRFCVPVFIMISGAMFLDPARPLSLKKLFGKNILRIVTAFVFWSGAYALLIPGLNWVLRSEAIDVGDVVRNFLTGHFHLWFLFTLVGLYIASPLLRKIVEDDGLTRYYLAFTFLFCYVVKGFTNLGGGVEEVVSTMVSQASLGFFGGYLGYFVLGYYLLHWQMPSGWKAPIYLLGVGSLVFTFLVTQAVSLERGEAVSLWYSNFAPNVWMASVAIFIFFREEVSRVRWSPRGLAAIERLSKLSFGMYLVHDFVNQLLTRVGMTTLSFHPMLSVPALSLVVFVVSAGVAYGLSRIPVVNQYIL